MRTQHNHRLPAAVAVLCALAAVAAARTAERPWRPSRAYDLPWYQKNQWRMTISNYGTFGYGVSSPGGEWPAGSGDMYIYGAGIWFGSIRRGPTGRDTLASVGYNPNSGKSEMTPGCYDNAPGGYAGRAFERVYVFPSDWPPNLADFPAGLADSVRTPLRVPSGDTLIPGYFHYVPRTAVSSGDAWAVFNDRDEANHTAGATPRSIGIEVYQSTYAWTLPWNQDIVFFKLDVRNRTADTIHDAYIGMVCDADVGNATDDRAGLILEKYIHSPDGRDSVFVDNMGYVWSDDAAPPGLVGFDFLQSPYVKDENGNIAGFDGVDNNGNGLIDEPAEGEQLGMTSFKIFTLTDADPVDDFQQYLAMAGYDYWDPEYPYNPYDSTDQAPADKRFLQSTGPFTLAPDEVATVTIGVIAAARAPGEASMPYYLALASRAAQAAYDNNWIMPEPPPSPNLTLIPGDGRVTLVWDNLPEDARDRFFPVAPALFNPYYVEQDFQGYKVYRSRSGQPGDWQLLTQFDRQDGIRYEDTTAVESLRTRGTDNGLTYSFVDSSNLRLGFPYYYAVTSYDVNYLSGDPDTTPPEPPDTLSLESGMAPERAVPRTDPGNYRPPSTDWVQTAGNPRLRLRLVPHAVTPYAVRDSRYHVRFLGPRYDAGSRRPEYRFWVSDDAGDTVFGLTPFTVDLAAANDTFRFVRTVFDSVPTLVANETLLVYDSLSGGWRDSVRVDTTRAWLPVSQVTLKLELGSIPRQFYREVRVVSGEYPEDSLAVAELANNPALWAYRGANYRLVWREHATGRPTVEVYDLDNEQTVRFRAYPLVGGSPDSADGWCFRTVRDATDTLGIEATRYLYVCGSQFQFKPGGGPVELAPAAGDTWLLYSRNLAPAPWFSAFQVDYRAERFLAGADSVALDVKVVPNPYVVRNEWERHPDFRKVKFINLPDRCVIRIYNLAGDLVKTIHHDDTRPDVGGLPNQYGGDEDWDILNETKQRPAPGLYVFHVESDIGSQVGKFALIY
ncbi:MAG: hypothetical protein R6X12_07520 [bacterium]